MKLVNVVKAFTLTIVRDSQLVKLRIEAGVQRLEDDIADHWYTLAHSEPAPKDVTRADTGVDDTAHKPAADSVAKASGKK